MKIPTRKIFFWLCVLVIFLLFMHHRFSFDGKNVLGRELSRFFDLNGEGNFPAWVSGSLFLLTAQAALITYFLGKKIYSKLFQIFNLVVFLLFMFFSFDEVSGFHESLTYISETKWVYLYFPIFAIVAVFFGYVFWREESSVRRFVFRISLGLFVFASGGLFLEWIYYRFGAYGVLERFKFRLEEGLEFLGVVIAFVGVLEGINELFSSRFEEIN